MGDAYTIARARQAISAWEALKPSDIDRPIETGNARVYQDGPDNSVVYFDQEFMSGQEYITTVKVPRDENEEIGLPNIQHFPKPI